MEEGNQITVKMGSKYVGTLWSYTAPFKEYEPNSLTSVAQLKSRILQWWVEIRLR